ncbi:hypothetical protein E2P81_ATG07665 [Venturia nashicola]|uniref:Uncharacterized protein n=1 Tax=Venturia nashicola TaxID=86259 RepID=A0A4Z1NIE3_9PEZI|nr:hypothetical protein E6O75_ATG07829 [Venturia nashicola]TLD22472.1 hypothetical protein E2P81_ATG07665 [Venturia nashicola]
MALNTSEYIWNPATCIITTDRFAYYGSFSFLKLPLKLLFNFSINTGDSEFLNCQKFIDIDFMLGVFKRMILEYLIDKAIVKLPQGKVIKAAHEWDTSPRAPAAQAPRRGPSGQTNAHIMQCSKHMSDVARTIVDSLATRI